jgi:hypothetical protein
MRAHLKSTEQAARRTALASAKVDFFNPEPARTQEPFLRLIPPVIWERLAVSAALP